MKRLLYFIFPFLLQTLNKEDEADKEKKPLWRKPQKKKGGKKGGGGGQKQKSKNKKKDNKCLDDASAATSGDTAQGSNSTVGDTILYSFTDDSFLEWNKNRSLNLHLKELKSFICQTI